MVTSFAAVTNLPTVISLLSAISNCPSRISHICLTKGGALSRVLSVALSSFGVRNGHLSLSCVSRYTIASSCFSAAATFFLSLLGPLDSLVELVMVKSMPRNHSLAVSDLLLGGHPLYQTELQLPGGIRDLEQKDLVQHDEDACQLIESFYCVGQVSLCCCQFRLQIFQVRGLQLPIASCHQNTPCVPFGY